ncbi:MAG: hypothetical protein J07HB67_00285 [halophilic archaeon J07HB67]|nr:MAG: hypothetical protein J07HB67_00285 [halophilic archaeon J07HB67]
MASDPAEFWRRRREITPTTDAADPAGYQLGLLADVTDPTVRRAYQSVHDGLDRFDCLDTAAAGGLHLTIKLFDITVTQSPDDGWSSADDEASPAVGRVDRVVSEVLSGHSPFEAVVTQFNLFPDVVYGEIADDGRLAALNRAVCSHPAISALSRDGEEFIPHLTLGHFQNDTDFEAFVEHLEANRELSLPPVTVDEVELVAYEVGGRPPSYDRIATYEL